MWQVREAQILLAVALVSLGACGNKQAATEPEPPPPHATLLRVPTEYATIQAGMDAAVDGDTVLVASGVYGGLGNANLNPLGKAIVIRSEQGPDSTIIDCLKDRLAGAAGFQIHLGETKETIIDGFTVRNAGAAGGSGHALRCTGASPTIRNCRFTGNPGGGLRFSRSLSEITRCRVEDSEGAAVVVLDSNVTFDRCVFRRNFTRGFGAIYAEASVIVIRDSELSLNTVERGQGGGIYLMRSRAELRKCVIAENYAEYGGGGIGASASTLWAVQCTIVENSTEDNLWGGGGGIYLGVMCAAELDHTIVSGNCGSEGPDLHGERTSTAFFYQTAIDTTRIGGEMHWSWYERVVTEDPGLCRLAGCNAWELGDYHLRQDSPCARSPYIGALLVGCE